MMGRRDLAAVIAEMRDALVAYQMDVDEPPPYKHRRMIQRANRLLALLLAEARLQNDGQVQENQEVARVDAMGDSRDNPTASEHETTPATVTLNHVNNEPQAWRDIASAPADGTWVLGFDAEEMPQQEVVRWTEDIHGNTATWRCSEDYVRSPTHWMPLLAALPETSAQQEEP